MSTHMDKTQFMKLKKIISIKEWSLMCAITVMAKDIPTASTKVSGIPNNISGNIIEIPSISSLNL